MNTLTAIFERCMSASIARSAFVELWHVGRDMDGLGGAEMLAQGAGMAPRVSADDTDLILQSDQSVACVNSRLAWSFEWAWMIYAVSVGYSVTTYNTTV